MQLSIDLTGREVLVTGTENAARQAVRRYQAAGAVVYRLSTPAGRRPDGPLPERPFLVAAVDDGEPGWVRAGGPMPRSRHPRLRLSRQPAQRAT